MFSLSAKNRERHESVLYSNYWYEIFLFWGGLNAPMIPLPPFGSFDSRLMLSFDFHMGI